MTRKERPPPSYLDLIAGRLAAAAAALTAAESENDRVERDKGLLAAVGHAQEALGFAGMAAAPYTSPVVPPAPASDRTQWLAALRHLAGARLFPDQLYPLIEALADLDRAKVAQGLKPLGNDQGGKVSVAALRARAIALEIEDEVIRQFTGKGGVSKATALIEDETGLDGRTLRRWRSEHMEVATELQPRSFRFWMPPLPSKTTDGHTVLIDPAKETDDERRRRLLPLLATMKLAIGEAQRK